MDTDEYIETDLQKPNIVSDNSWFCISVFYAPKLCSVVISMLYCKQLISYAVR